MMQDQVAKIFKEQFNTTPELFFSPGRINLIGEHIDYNNGFVMPAAIDKGIYFAIAKNNSNTANFFSVDFDESFSVDLNHIQKNTSWKNYVSGILYVLEKHDFKLQGFDCVFGGNIPVGAGLSSSAALEAGLLFALNDIFSFDLSRKQIARFAQEAEHSFPGVKCGIMDMFASLHGKDNHVILLDCDSLDYEYYPLQLNQYSLVLINSKVHHSLAGSEYNKRRQECEEGFKILKENNSSIQSFRDVTVANIKMNEHLFHENVYNRILYVVEEIERTKKAAKFLQANDLTAFGELVFETHEGLDKLYNTSCDELNFLVAEAKKHKEIIGSRLMGGGFGGCTINIIEKEKADEIISKITSAYTDQFNVFPEVYNVQLCNGTYKI
jgi:galactokinase